MTQEQQCEAIARYLIERNLTKGYIISSCIGIFIGICVFIPVVIFDIFL